MTTPTTALSAKDVAEKLGTDAKTLRVFLRSITYTKNDEGRYSFTPKDVATLKTRFPKWVADREAAKATIELKSA
ncbi:hypothetical protein P3F83_23525 [Mycobacteroides immunogenum]|uniref:hypothetical protein n=1 Tax=Mycobacteroides immunogenum TaxID=83262 RepID=UPI0025B77AC4|nr:hypothetical protein [Mycobacteroides immunogenum]WJR33382.1 hypothetical protein P3F83_23525 [Mycobacteroides immunogenum]